MGKNTTILPIMLVGLSSAFGLCAATTAETAPPSRSHDVAELATADHARRLRGTTPTAATQRVPAAPGGAAPLTKLSQPQSRETLLLSATPESQRLFGRRLLDQFEARQRRFVVRTVVGSDRNCIEHVAMNTVAAAIVGVPLSEQERAVGLSTETIGYHLVAPVVHASNPIRSVFEEDLRKLLNGKTKSWWQIGWPQNHLVQPVCLPANGEDASDHFRKLLTLEGAAAKRAIRRDSETGVAAFVRKNPGALGLVSVKTLRSVAGIRPLLVCHIEPTVENYRRGAYQRGMRFQLVHRGAPLSKGLRALLDFINTGHGKVILHEALLTER